MMVKMMFHYRQRSKIDREPFESIGRIIYLFAVVVSFSSMLVVVVVVVDVVVCFVSWVDGR